MALTLDQPAFVAECPFPILLAVNEPAPPTSQELFATEERTTGLMADPVELPSPQPTELPALYAVKKTQMVIPQSIIVGRASASDILISDRHISKLHALFQLVGDVWELSDAGSRNGTCVGNVRLQPRGAAVTVSYGDIISFGYRTFFFLDADTCWQQLSDRRR